MVAYGVELLSLEDEVIDTPLAIVAGPVKSLLCICVRLFPFLIILPSFRKDAIDCSEALLGKADIVVVHPYHVIPLLLCGSSAHNLSFNVRCVGAAAAADSLLYDVEEGDESRFIVEAVALLLATMVSRGEAGAEHGLAPLFHHLDSEVLGTETVGESLEEGRLCDDINPLDVDTCDVRVDSVARPIKAADGNGCAAELIAFLALCHEAARELRLVYRLQEFAQDDGRYSVNDLCYALLDDVAELANLRSGEDRHLGRWLGGLDVSP